MNKSSPNMTQVSVVPTVNVLLSTYRSGNFLKPFLESLLNQYGVHVNLRYHVDDGDENTALLIGGMFSQSKISKNSLGLGVPEAFIRLLTSGGEPSNFWAFADQDDIWEPDKLLSATQALASLGSTPALWVSHYQLISAEDSGARDAAPIPRRVLRPGFGNALIETLAPGCCMVWNGPLQALLQRTERSQGILMHDSWVYLVAAAFGAIIVDPRPLVRYRIHDHNAIGLANGAGSRSRRAIRNWVHPPASTLATQAHELVQTFGAQLRSKHHLLASDLANLRKARLAIHWANGNLYRQAPIDNLLFAPSLFVLRN